MSRSVRITIFLGVFALSLLALAAAYTYKKGERRPSKTLETFGRIEEDSIAPDGSHHVVTRVHRVGAFAFTDQRGRTVTQADMAGKIYVADFIFTTCQTICPPMSRNLAALVQKLSADDNVRFISHTVDPETDSVPVLAAYAERHRAPAGKWFFVTGPKKALYDMARYQYFVTATQGDGGADDFVHTQNMVLVDRAGHIRGYYDGTSDQEMAKLEKDIRVLEEE